MAHLHQCNIFEINKQDILKLTSEEKTKEFIEWLRKEAPVIRFPWGDKGFSLQHWIVDKKDFDSQNVIFSNCSIDNSSCLILESSYSGF